MRVNELGQPVGDAIPGWTHRDIPRASVLAGTCCRLERLDADRHAEDLFRADGADIGGASWTYLPYGPFADLASYREWVEWAAGSTDPLFYAVIDTDPLTDAGTDDCAVGVLSLLRMQPDVGSIEVGHVHYSPALQRRRAATEAQYLLMAYVFDELRYRRYEWKCDALNAASRRAAQRLGFRYEGTFRKASVVKGRNRDTAWYSIVDSEWPGVRTALRAWLSGENFDDSGRQLAPLRVPADES